MNNKSIPALRVSEELKEHYAIMEKHNETCNINDRLMKIVKGYCTIAEINNNQH